MERKIIEKLEQLPNLSGEEVLGVDVETTSFADAVEAFHPFNGHRIAGAGVMTRSGDGWYLPLRHAPMETSPNLPFEGAIAWLRDLGKRSRKWIGHNIKFDCRFLYQDGITLEGELIDTVVLARLVDALLLSGKLDYLSKKFLGEAHYKDDAEVKKELKARKTKDYGRVPVDILGRYCLQDLDATMHLEEYLQKNLPEESAKLWEIEKKLTRVLLRSELRGVNVPRAPLVKFTHAQCKRLLELQEEMEKIACQPVDVLSNKSFSEVMSKLCIKPVAYTETGQPSWDAEALSSYHLPFTDAAAEYKEISAAYSSFGEGWLSRLADDETLHPNFRQSGTKTGRLSCEDPNFQNLNVVAKGQVRPRAGHEFLSCDYCLTGDTKIITERGVMTMIEVVKEKPAVLSSADGDTVVFKPVTRAALVGFVPVLKVTLEDGSTVRCTADHKWMTLEGELVKTDELVQGQRLAHVHCGRVGPGSYPTWYTKTNRRYVYQHKLLAEHLFGPLPPDHEVHHIDENKDNCVSGNLELRPTRLHKSEHGAANWGKMTEDQKTEKIIQLQMGIIAGRRSYEGDQNPNWKEKIQKTCEDCGAEFEVQPCKVWKKRCCVCAKNHRVVSVEPDGEDYVYQLTVADTHTYVLDNGLISANSQIEFRLFAHYTNAEDIISKYRSDPNTDYHQGTADMLGIPRKAAKTMNFGLIYGMGREKLQGALTLFIRDAIHKGEQAVLTALANFNYGEAVTLQNAHRVASNVYNAYHRMFPMIRDFGKRVERVVMDRGRVKNLLGRVYKIPPELAFKARNWVIQGSAGDLLRDRMVDLDPVLMKYDAYLIANVHDEVLLEIPIEAMQECAREVITVMQRPSIDLRVPILVDPKRCVESWADKKSLVM